VVTGASSGIGRALALESARHGDSLVLAARGPASLEEVAAACRRAGAASVLAVPTDVGDDAAVAALVRTATEQHGRLDVVLSCAGTVAYGRTEHVPAGVFEGVLRTDLLGSVNLARHVVPVLREQGQGTLLLVGSVVGYLRVPSMSPYVISKWGVRSLAAQLRLENRDLPGVRILHVAPGGVDTPIYRQAATTSGYDGRPPPPVATPERTARQVLRRVRRGRGRTQLSLANDVIRLGQALVPGVYDRIVGPLFDVVATDLTRPVAHTTGNVLASRENAHAVRGGHDHAVLGIARNLLARLRGAGPPER